MKSVPFALFLLNHTVPSVGQRDGEGRREELDGVLRDDRLVEVPERRLNQG